MTGKARLFDQPHELHVQVEVTLRDQVWAAAKSQDRSPSQWIRAAIREKLARDAQA